MKRRRLLIGLLIAVNLLFALAAVPATESALTSADWLLPLYASVCLAQGHLLSFWVALGRKRAPWRLVGVVVAAAVLIGTGEIGYEDSVARIGTFIALLQMSATALPLLLLRLLGLAVADVLCDDLADGPREFQYSLRGLLMWTAALAVILSTIHYLPEELVSDMRTWDSAVLFALNVLIGVSALWVGLGRRRPAVRISVLGLVCLAAIGTSILMFGDNETIMHVLFHFSESLWLVGSLCLIRLAGYRLVWRGRIVL